MTHLTLPLAKELKDAGFPQGWGAHLSRNSGDEYIRIPTLEQLIDECGSDFVCLTSRNYKGQQVPGQRYEFAWIAAGIGQLATERTPLEAVTKLWILLHKKKIVHDHSVINFDGTKSIKIEKCPSCGRGKWLGVCGDGCKMCQSCYHKENGLAPLPSDFM